jgi:phosphate starvation-inducible membrane PsiE
VVYIWLFASCHETGKNMPEKKEKKLLKKINNKLMLMMGQLVNLFLVASNFNFLERIFSLQKIHLKYTIFFKKNNNNKG